METQRHRGTGLCLCDLSVSVFHNSLFRIHPLSKQSSIRLKVCARSTEKFTDLSLSLSYPGIRHGNTETPRSQSDRGEWLTSDGQVLVSVTDKARHVVLGPQSMKENDHLNLSNMKVKLLRLKNIAIGSGDFAEFEVLPPQ